MCDRPSPGSLKLTSNVQPVFDFYWLRASEDGALSGDFGIPIESRSGVNLEIDLEDAGASRVRARTGDSNKPDALAEAIGAACGPGAPDPGPAVRRLSDEIHAALSAAIEAQCSTALAAGAAPLDGLPHTPEVEVHLPLLRPRDCPGQIPPQLTVAVHEDGRIFALAGPPDEFEQKKNAYQTALALLGPSVFPGHRFTLTFTDRRPILREHAQSALPALLRPYDLGLAPTDWIAGLPADVTQFDASLVLSISGDLAQSWLEAPETEDPNFFPVYAAVSLAVQRAARRWLPYAYFSDAGRYWDLSSAAPVMIYQHTPPCPGQPKYEFAYDVLDRGCSLLARPSLARQLAVELGRVRQAHVPRGETRLRRWYAPERASAILANIRNEPRQLNALLVADACFIESFVQMGLRGREFACPAHTPRAGRARYRFLEELDGTLRRKLRRLYNGQDFSSMGSLLLIEATAALNRALGKEAPVAAAVRLTAGPFERVFVNSAFRERTLPGRPPLPQPANPELQPA